MNFKSARCVVFAQINDKIRKITKSSERENVVVAPASECSRVKDIRIFVIYLRENYTTGRLEIHTGVRDNISLVLELMECVARFVDFVETRGEETKVRNFRFWDSVENGCLRSVDNPPSSTVIPSG